MENTSRGKLFVVSTPIGNLSDMTPRAVETLKSVELVLAEDTRSFARLASRYGIETKSESFHDHSERQKTPGYVARLAAGERFALVSEAGTPTLSDPGYRLVRACREQGITVEPIPGVSAAIAALSVSGLPTNRFLFEGFLPQRPGRRDRRLHQLLASGTTFILYESPHRIVATLGKIAAIAPEREVFVARELTKLHEEGLFGTAKAVHETLDKRESVKGEIVLVVAPGERNGEDDVLEEEIASY